MTRWMHPPELSRAPEQDNFDPVIEGARDGLSCELSLAIWERVCADATDSAGRLVAHQAQRRFRELTARVAARGGRLRPEIGQLTRVQTEIVGVPRGAWAVELTPRPPGHTTLVATETRRGTMSGWLPLHLLPRDISKPSVPGRWTLVDNLPSPRLGFGDYRVLGLKGVLQQLGPDHPLRAELIAAAAVADRSIAGRATLWCEPLPRATTPNGHALWHVAERHAATLYRRAVHNGADDERDPAVESALQQRRAGQPVPTEVCREMERELGVSLAGARVHTDAVAAQAASALDAEAFTIGEDIFFAEGMFAPDTRSGKKLLVHELTHVAQALRGDTGPTGDGLRVSQPGEPLEREADDVAARVDEAATRGASAHFDDVRLHTGADAAARALGARAFAVGGDVFFRNGAYDPHHRDGQQLIAHGVAYTMQARGTAAPTSGATASQPGNAFETEANRVAAAMVDSAPAGIVGSTGAPIISRSPLRRPDEVAEGAIIDAAEVHVGPASRLVLQTLPRGTAVMIVGDLRAEWLHVRFADGEGYVLGNRVVVSDSRPPPNVVPTWLRAGATRAAVSRSEPAVRRMPYQAQISGWNRTIRSAPRDDAHSVITFREVDGIFVNVLRDAGDGWVEVDHQGARGFLLASQVHAVDTSNPERGVEDDVLRRTSHAESNDQAGHFGDDSFRDNIGLGSWTQGRIGLLMDRYVAVARQADQEQAAPPSGDGSAQIGPNEERLYNTFGGQPHFRDIRERFRHPSGHAGTARDPDFRLRPEERDMFEHAGQTLDLIRRAEQEQLHVDFMHYVSHIDRLDPPYPFLDETGTISEVALALIANADHMGVHIGAAYRAALAALGGPRRHRRQPDEQPNGIHARGEAAFLEVLIGRFVQYGHGNRSRAYQNRIRGRYQRIVEVFGGSARRYPVRRPPAPNPPWGFF